MNKGIIISVDGIDGSGKSTSLKYLVDSLKENGFDVIQTREPGGTQLGEQLRELMLHKEMNPMTEALLMFAARSEHIEKVIRPALETGKCVVCDRFEDSSYAYQGAGRGLGSKTIDILSDLVLGQGADRIEPTYTWFFDVTAEVAKNRLSATRDMDRFERQGEDYFNRVRQAYWDRIYANPTRYQVVDSSKPREMVKALIEVQVRAVAEQQASIDNTATFTRPKFG